ncbi:MAG: GNAT family N-acetyltransferase [Nocardioidaceae bacterium]|nr:MAG: GNAT family N-acetyltransferase [Nocardioidaceae bacterium]
MRPGSVRLGAGRALVDAAVTWAEECGAATVMALAGAGDRDANRYFARLGFAAVATVRAAPVSLLRATSFPVEPPVYARTGRRSSRLAGSVLAQRRRQRRLSGQ